MLWPKIVIIQLLIVINCHYCQLTCRTILTIYIVINKLYSSYSSIFTARVSYVRMLVRVVLVLCLLSRVATRAVL